MEEVIERLAALEVVLLHDYIRRYGSAEEAVKELENTLSKVKGTQPHRFRVQELLKEIGQ